MNSIENKEKEEVKRIKSKCIFENIKSKFILQKYLIM